MAMAFDDRREAEQPRSIKVLGERSTTRRGVPAQSRAATARKLEEVDMPETEETTDAEMNKVAEALKPRGRAAQVNAARLREQEEREQEQTEAIAKLESRRDELVERLDKGAARIEEARAKGKDVQEWEDYWISLLRQYEQTCDKLRELASV